MSVRWEGFSHEEIYARVHSGPGRNASVGAEQVWAETESVILEIERSIAEAIGRARGDWTGLASDQTLDAMTPLGRWALDAANDAGITASAVTNQGEQAQELRNAMPEPNTALRESARQDTITNESLRSAQDLFVVEQEAANRAARAVDLMNTYTNNSDQNRRNMDFWTLPPQVTVETTVPPPAAGAAPVGTGPGGGVGAVDVAPAGTPVAAAPPGGATPAAVPPAGPAPGAPPAVPPAGSVPVGTEPPVVGPGPGPVGNDRPGGVPVGSAGRPVVPPANTGGVPRGPGGETPGTRAGPPAVPSVPVPPVPPVPVGSPGRAPGGPQPVTPGVPPRPVPAPTWRDVVPTTREPGVRPPLPAGGDQERPAPGSRTGNEPSARPGAPATPAEPQPRGAVPRSPAFSPSSALYPPMTTGMAGAAQDQEHRRPDYLIDDTDAFADDRWFPGAVITPEDVPPRRR